MSSTTDLSNLNNQVSQIYGTGAINIPVGTTSQRPTPPSTGMVRWNTTLGKLEFYGPTQWNHILNEDDIRTQFVEIAAPRIEAPLDATGNKLTNVADPTANSDAVTLGFLEGRFATGTGINADTLDGMESWDFATQNDVTALQIQVGLVQTNLDDHIMDLDNPHQTTKAQVGLDQVDNTSDMNKPISTATQTALNSKVNRSGDVMMGALSMGYNNLTDIANFVGSIWHFATENPPAGFLECNGIAVSRTTYSRLFARIGTRFGAGNGTTTFNLPDLRGIFIRGWSNTAPTDAGRQFGSIQPDMLKTHTHTGATNVAGNHTHTISGDTPSGQQNKIDLGNDILYADDGSLPRSTTSSSAGAHNHELTIEPTGGVETRPVNIALLACIMY